MGARKSPDCEEVIVSDMEIASGAYFLYFWGHIVSQTRGAQKMARATLDWSQCPAVESVPGRLNGAWVFRDTRMPVSAVFENLEAGATIEEIIEQFDITREQINSVLEFAARSLDPISFTDPMANTPADAHSF